MTSPDLDPCTACPKLRILCSTPSAAEAPTIRSHAEDVADLALASVRSLCAAVCQRMRDTVFNDHESAGAPAR